ncbi:17181_t:CDS:2, partial [Racocetra persica]
LLVPGQKLIPTHKDYKDSLIPILLIQRDKFPCQSEILIPQMMSEFQAISLFRPE